MKNIKVIHSKEELDSFCRMQDAALVYFSHEECNVCKVLKPKIQQLLADEYPNMAMAYADTVNHPEIAGQNSIFTVPTILVFFGGKEYIRMSRNIGVQELGRQIGRPYGMLFG